MIAAKPLGAKSREAIGCRGFLTVYEGAVRSTKTVTSLVQWLRYVESSPESVFLMSGNTMGSLARNCIHGSFGLLVLARGRASLRSDTDGSKFISLPCRDRGTGLWIAKRIYYLGADTEAAYKKIQGMTIGGWYADEINLHSRTFVAVALARSLASTDRQNIWTLNPEPPTHWIYREYLDKYDAERPEGYRWFHFDLGDNPALTPGRRKEIEAQFTGVFYRRYILGQRVRAEGRIYTSFENNRPGEPGNVLDDVAQVPGKIYRVTFGLDFGGNASATSYTATGYFIFGKESPHPGKVGIVVLDEYYDPENRNVESITAAWVRFVARLRGLYPLDRAFGDSAEQLIIKSLNSAEYSLRVENARKGPINERIRLMDVLYAQRRAFILRKCRNTIDAVENAVYDEKAKGEDRLDDGSSNIDSLDSMEYSIERDAGPLLRGEAV